MAFSAQNAQRELANRKILEELQLKKQILLKGGVTSLNTGSTLVGISNLSANNGENYSLSSAQRTLQTVNLQSTGYFISQDSSFGNLILPVLPRFEIK